MTFLPDLISSRFFTVVISLRPKILVILGQEPPCESAAGSWPILMSSVSSKTVKNPQMWVFSDAAVMWAPEPLGMTMYIHIYIHTYTSIHQQNFYQSSDRFKFIT